VGTLRQPNPSKLIIHPEKPLCDGAMYSPGFFPKGYLCKPMNGGYEVVQAVAKRFNFDPATTPWNEMTLDAQQAFLFGLPERLEVTHQSRNGTTSTHMWHYPGFYGWVRDWDTGGTYTDAILCPECHGARLRQEYASVTLQRYTLFELNEMPIIELAGVLSEVDPQRLHSGDQIEQLNSSLATIRKRLYFLIQVGLGYLHLNRDSATLSAGEAQRIKLAGLLGSGLTALTILVDEPSRGMHPSEVDALVGVLQELRSEGNTVIVVEHDPTLIKGADYLVDIGPGAGIAGGKIVAVGEPDRVLQTETTTAQWLRGNRQIDRLPVRRRPKGWLTIYGAKANNLRGEDISFPLGVLVGICGVSGSGKSTLLIDTLGRALAPKKQTTSVAHMPVDPGEHERIDNALKRTMLVDQVKQGVRSPAIFLGLANTLHRIYAQSEDAVALGLDEKLLKRRCSVCGGNGSTSIDMGFLPNVHTVCEACNGTGHLPEAWDVRVRGVALPELMSMTIEEVYALHPDHPSLSRVLTATRDVGLGYLVLKQPGYALSGGEAQRLKIAKELCRKTTSKTLYILDEPTVGQHLEDVARLNTVLHHLVDTGNSVFVVEHHMHLLAACDWLLELGPGGGPSGGKLIASGTPEDVAKGETPTARYLREVLEIV
jgi:excinuclease ABC subunit A